MSERAKQPSDRDRRRGKPLSLDPLSYEEAVRDLLKVKPEPKAKKGTKKKPSRDERLGQ